MNKMNAYKGYISNTVEGSIGGARPMHATIVVSKGGSEIVIKLAYKLKLDTKER